MRPKTEVRIRNFKEDMLDKRKQQMFGEFKKYNDDQKNFNLMQSLHDSRKELRTTSSDREDKMEQQIISHLGCMNTTFKLKLRQSDSYLARLK